jgi:hypothetical protein
MVFSISEVFLLVTENLDVRYILSLMLTSRRTYALFKTYEKSITKRWITRNLAEGALIPPQGAVLASVFHELAGGDFCIPILTRPGVKLIAELEGREERILVLFGNPARSKFTMAGCLLAALHDTDIYARLTPTQVSKLVDGLKSAMRTADRIADWAAEWHVDKMSKGSTTSVVPEMSRDHFPEDPESIRNIHVPRTEQLLGMEPKDHTVIFLLGELIATVCRGLNFQRSREVSVTNVGPIIELLLRYGTVAPFSTLSHDFGEGPTGELILRKLYRNKFC